MPLFSAQLLIDFVEGIMLITFLELGQKCAELGVDVATMTSSSRETCTFQVNFISYIPPLFLQHLLFVPFPLAAFPLG
jgi:hypothetical protein